MKPSDYKKLYEQAGYSPELVASLVEGLEKAEKKDLPPLQD